MTEQPDGHRHSVRRIIIHLIALFAIVLMPETGFGKPVPRVGVIYPDVREPYLTVFKKIIEGIEEELGARVIQYSINDKTKLPALENWIKTEQIDSVVALGNAGLSLSQSLGDEYHKVVGAVMIDDQHTDEKMNAISMAPDPFKLLGKLKELSPAVKQVYVVYNPGTQSWLIQRAKEAAAHFSINFYAEAAENTRDAAVLYREMLKKQQPGSDAIWLLQDDPALKERSILYMILKEAWDRSLLVFSSNPSHVSKGALFSLYPDNKGLGRQLAVSAVKVWEGNEMGIQPVGDLLTAVNIRTAEHLDLNVSHAQRREFDMVFPAR